MDAPLPFDALAGASSWIDELPDGLLVCGPDGAVVVANQQLCEMSGYSRRELVGMAVDELVPRSRRADHAALREGFVAEGRTRPMGHPGADLRLARKSGEAREVEISLSPISGDGARGVVAIVRDVAERNRVETALRTSNELLSLADERERIARDLHDTVLQRLFGLGLELQAVAIRTERSRRRSVPSSSRACARRSRTSDVTPAAPRPRSS